jgi:hypothetical protein
MLEQFQTCTPVMALFPTVAKCAVCECFACCLH